MKKLFLIIASVITLVFVISAFRLNSSEIRKGENVTSIKLETTEQKQVKYIMKATDGTVCVYYPDSDKPYRVLDDIMFESLPEYDRNLLITGIKIYSDEQLVSLIEDYDS